jgi:hypothetical protein
MDKGMNTPSAKSVNNSTSTDYSKGLKTGATQTWKTPETINIKPSAPYPTQNK